MPFSGDNESGKTTLVSKLRGVEEQKTGSALEYMYITVKDEYGDGEFGCIKCVHLYLYTCLVQCPSVCLSVQYGLLIQEQKGVEN